ncbi:MAG: B12-binding domain-containing radical SAM protein [Magnetococcales bacterium]|nr:B12-binding domain-containing radical SAM protein [Magnetococcales bacterium]
MKTLLINVPIRNCGTDFPPYGILSIMQSVRKHGVSEIDFLNIDQKRLQYQQVVEYIKDAKPDILGISCVVSTSYKYLKDLSLDIKKNLPETLIVIGGNMAAAGEVLLHKTGVDLCVTGEGERTLCNIIEKYKKNQTNSLDGYDEIPGLLFLKGDEVVNTGYEQEIKPDEIYEIDWRDLENSSDINHYIVPFKSNKGVASIALWGHDPRLEQPHRQSKNVTTLISSKGCVAKCTFCHRWAKGIRFIPVDLLIVRIKDLIEKYDIGFLSFGDENFGANKRWLGEFCSKIKALDILWAVGGMRANSASIEEVQMMKQAGCCSVQYGMESGSDRILNIMEKKISVEQNKRAIDIIVESDLYTTCQLVLGMPGESPESIKETIEFAKYISTRSAKHNLHNIAIFYAQALPGTPLYEFGRHNNLIAQGIDGEDEYLLSISNVNAADSSNTINFTDYPALIWKYWSVLIQINANYVFVKRNGLDLYNQRMEEKSSLPIYNRYPVAAFKLRHFLVIASLLVTFKRNGIKTAFEQSIEYLKYFLFGKKRSFKHEYRSLRKIVKEELGPVPSDKPSMFPLRLGR